MTDPTTAREALIVEAVGERRKLMQALETLAPVLNRHAEAAAGEQGPA